tara:strand:- start:9597 stop:11492 length:1896 start_codon:yes stop_codon:yes gene_type:complete
MPPSKATSSLSKAKRKAEPEGSSADESDPKTPRNEETEQPQSAEDIAMSMFLSDASIPCPEAKHSSGGGGSVNAEGIVVRANKISVQGKTGMVPKMQITVLISKIIATGNNTVVTTGVPGLAFGLPTKQLEASPEEIAKDANARGPLVVDIETDSKAGYLGMISTSFYTDPQNSKPGKKGPTPGEAPSAEACTPGTRVLVTGISNTFGKVDRDGRLPLYTNAKKIQPLQAAVPPGLVAVNLIEEACSPAVQATSSLLLSSCMHGFFGLNYDQKALADQAKCFMDKWESLVNNTAVKLDSIAAVHTGDDAATVGSAILAHATRVRGISPSDAAQGMAIFNCDMQKDCVTPYVAPIVQRGVKPGAVAGDMCMALFDATRRSSLPTSFCDAIVADVSFKGNLIQVDYRLFFIGDKDMAIEAIQNQENPLLKTTNAAASVKMSKRSFGPETLGTVVSSKIEMGTKELMFTMDHTAIAHVFPRPADSISVDGHFTSTVGYDLVDGITKVGIAVSQEWIDANMLGGRGVLIHKHNDDAELVDPTAGIGPAPSLTKQLYQAVSEGSFDFDSLKPPEGKTTKFYVVYSGCSANVKNTPTVATSVDEGERHLSDIVPAVRDDGDIKAFLKDDALVYAVAV